MSRKLRVAVVGTGFWGKNHARVYTELEETELVAVCDVNPERAKTIAAKFGAKPYTQSSKMYRKEEVDAVSICTWSTKLSAEATRALKAGKHVLVEKPMATTTRQAQKMVSLAGKNELNLMVGFLMRFIPGIQHMKKAIEKREIGNLVCATARRVSAWPERIGDVGVVKDIGIHDIDIMRYLFAQDPVAVYAKAGRMKHTKFEDYAQIMLAFPEGKTAFIEVNWLTPYKIRRLIVTGSEAIMTLDYITQELVIDDAEKSVKPRYPWKEPLKEELQSFARSVIKGEEPAITGVDGLKALRIAEAALKSAEKGTVIKLKG